MYRPRSWSKKPAACAVGAAPGPPMSRAAKVVPICPAATRSGANCVPTVPAEMRSAVMAPGVYPERMEPGAEMDGAANCVPTAPALIRSGPRAKAPPTSRAPNCVPTAPAEMRSGWKPSSRCAARAACSTSGTKPPSCAIRRVIASPDI